MGPLDRQCSTNPRCMASAVYRSVCKYKPHSAMADGDGWVLQPGTRTVLRHRHVLARSMSFGATRHRCLLGMRRCGAPRMLASQSLSCCSSTHLSHPWRLSAKATNRQRTRAMLCAYAVCMLPWCHAVTVPCRMVHMPWPWLCCRIGGRPLIANGAESSVTASVGQSSTRTSTCCSYI